MMDLMSGFWNHLLLSATTAVCIRPAGSNGLAPAGLVQVIPASAFVTAHHQTDSNSNNSSSLLSSLSGGGSNVEAGVQLGRQQHSQEDDQNGEETGLEQHGDEGDEDDDDDDDEEQDEVEDEGQEQQDNEIIGISTSTTTPEAAVSRDFTSAGNGNHDCLDDNNRERNVKEQEGGNRKRTRKGSIQRVRYSKEEYRCKQCPYACTTERAFLRHSRSCDDLAQSNDDKNSPPNHPVSCPICGKDRKNEEVLTAHMLKHRLNKYFCCDLCKFKTLQLKKLIQHRRMHTGEKPHLCPFCSYRSSRRDNLRSHARRMHKKNDLPCDTFTPRSMVLCPRRNVSEQ